MDTFRNVILIEKKDNIGKKCKQKENDHDDDDHIITNATIIGGDLVFLLDFELVNHVSDESMWIIDNGTTLHITLKNEFFTHYTYGNFGVLKMVMMVCIR